MERREGRGGEGRGWRAEAKKKKKEYGKEKKSNLTAAKSDRHHLMTKRSRLTSPVVSHVDVIYFLT